MRATSGLKTLSYVALVAIMSMVATGRFAVSAWVMSPLTTSETQTTSSKTALFMFDWMNPNKKTDEKKKDESNNDFFGNMFKINTPTTSSHETIDKAKEETSTPSAAVATTTEESSLDKAKADDFVADSFNDADTMEKETVAVAEASTTESSETASSDTSASAIHHGKVYWFDSNKGFGFISEVDKDGNFLYPKEYKEGAIFVHQSDLVVSDPNFFRRLYNRELVDFQLENDAKGRRKATHVTGIGGTDLKCNRRQKDRQEMEDPQTP